MMIKIGSSKKIRIAVSSDAGRTVYDDKFFDQKQQGAFSSASVIVPIVMKLISPKSAIDFGCGRGIWLKVFQDNGVKTIKGLDGSYINPSSLVIDPRYFESVDLASSFRVDQQYDIAICLEVAEHLPIQASRQLISMLTAAAPIVLFSAAIPGQGGHNHINEQWHEYWERLFTEHNFHRIDPIRRHIMDDIKVEWWYRQNIFLYVSTNALLCSEALRCEKDMASSISNEWVYNGLYKDLLSRYSTTSKIWRELRNSVLEAVKRRMRREIPWF